MMEQYLQIKNDYPDTILFFRLGDFYEMFFDDAKIASEELDLVLTGKLCGLEERAPMCGVPFHSCEGYIAKLVSRGYKVAICEQMENPALAKGIVKREVIRVITPGTVIESSMLEDGQNNYLCSIHACENETGVCFADVSTGEFYVTAISGSDVPAKINNQLATFQPKEILLNPSAAAMDLVVRFIKARLGAFTETADDLTDYSDAAALVEQTLNPAELQNLVSQNSPASVFAVAAVIRRLQDTRKQTAIETPTAVEVYSENQYMALDMSARRNLELTRSMMTGDKKHSLLWVIDKTKTPMGKRLIRRWLENPLLSIPKITRRQNAVAEMTDAVVKRDKIRQALTGVTDMERLVTRIVYGAANARELRTLCAAIGHLPGIKALLAGASSAFVQQIEADIDELQDIAEQIDCAIEEEPPFTLREGGLIKAGYNAELDELHSIMNDTAGLIAEIEEREKAATGIPKLKVGYNKVFGYYIEVTNSYKELVPDTYIRKQTLVNAERYITDELKKLESRIIGAKDRSTALEYELFCAVRKSVADSSERIQSTARALARLDTVCSLAEVAEKRGYVCPRVDDSGEIRITDGRHPVVEALLDGGVFVPNDTLLDKNDNRCAIITGPNMAGKSTYMRQIALIVILAQMGSFVPASSAQIGVCDAIFTRVGASDDLATGQSTFMVEMNEVATILKNATASSLIVLDEIGRGTSTFDGMSIARAVLEYVCKKRTLGAKTLFATHYHELTAMEGMLDGVKNYSIAVKKRGDDITFLRRIVRGGADESFGIEVAKLAGVPDSVVRRAKAILKELEANKIEIDFKAEEAVQEEPEEIQYNFASEAREELIRILQATDVNTLTPIEAMQTLNDLVQKSRRLQD
ncbi:MAG TPA: DNA mismatch repair protein MutS [Candidatus Scubalenecus merdavium]|uniref:DNA mismatch repair protein MutS n=1 Tax=Candidatus Scybalenecus merdavium TaxID=2840939 RepID=A0A9D1MTL9_9FIRM|nr:DNA mismatch repair protein MutS [Candidatus Scubalenecus merdavium]